MTRFGNLWLDNVWPAIPGLLCALAGVVDGAHPLWLVVAPVGVWVLWQIGAKDWPPASSGRPQNGVVRGDGDGGA